MSVSVTILFAGNRSSKRTESIRIPGTLVSLSYCELLVRRQLRRIAELYPRRAQLLVFLGAQEEENRQGSGARNVHPDHGDTRRACQQIQRTSWGLILDQRGDYSRHKLGLTSG